MNRTWQCLLIAAWALVLGLSAAAQEDERTELNPEARQHWERAREHLQRLAGGNLKASDQKKLQRLALDELEEAHKLAPRHDALTYDLGFFYYRLGQYARAVRTLEPLHERSPDHLEGTQLLASSCLRSKKYARSEVLFKKILERHPGHLRTLSNLAAVYHAWKKWEQLAATYRTILELEDSADARLGLANALRNTGEHEAALAALEPLLEGDGSADAMAMAVQLHLDLKQYDKTVERADAFLKKYPDDRSARAIRSLKEVAQKALRRSR